MGMSLAIELGLRGIHCMILEKGRILGEAPRVKTVHVRTMEHFHRWGISEWLSRDNPLGINHPSNVIFATHMSGHLLTKFENVNWCAPGRNPLYSEHAQWIPQNFVEAALKEKCNSIPYIHFVSGELYGIQQTCSEVVATAKSAGESFSIRSRFLVGCDGVRSTVRECIGGELEGSSESSNNFVLIFKSAQLRTAHKFGPAVQYWLVNAPLPGILGTLGNDKWYFGVTRTHKVITKSDCTLNFIETLLNCKIPDFELLAIDEWKASFGISSIARKHRVFLAGDACHVHPPYGGFGMNLGVGDAVDLGWKIAAVLKGYGNFDLLESYEQERRMVHEMIIDAVKKNNSFLANEISNAKLDFSSEEGVLARNKAALLIQQRKLPEFCNLGLVKGYRYVSGILFNEDEEDELDFINFVPSSSPGRVAPHLWMLDGTSLYDSFGPWFTFLICTSNNVDVRSIDTLLRNVEVPLKVVEVSVPAAKKLYKSFTIIRPDQHVAWRDDDLPADLQNILSKILGFDTNFRKKARFE